MRVMFFLKTINFFEKFANFIIPLTFRSLHLLMFSYHIAR